MADGCSNQIRFLIVAAFILLAMELNTAFCQQSCPRTAVLMRAQQYKKFARTPNYPRTYPKDASCKWTIRAEPGYRIRFTVEHSFIEQSYGCGRDYAEVFDGNTSMRKFCGSDTPEVTSTSNVLHVVFESDSSVEYMGMNFSYYSGVNFNTSIMKSETPKIEDDKKTNKVTLFVAIGAAVLCSILFVIVLCVCTKRCGCPCRNTGRTVEPVDSTRRHDRVNRTNSLFTSHMNRSEGSLPTDEVISLRVLSPPPYISRSPPSIDSPTNSSSPPPPYSFNDPHPSADQSDSLPSYPGEVSRY